MSNPFHSLGLPLSSVRKNKGRKFSEIDLDQEIESSGITPLKLRDRVILLLRHKYGMWPSEISSLNISDIDLDAGLIFCKRGPLVIARGDLLEFRRWLAVRKLYAQVDNSAIISLHWTSGRSIPHRRIGVRGIFQICQKYRRSQLRSLKTTTTTT